MNNLKVNQTRKKSAREVAEVLNNCEMLFDFSLEDVRNRIELRIQTDSKKVEYTELNAKNMGLFLKELIKYVDNKEDIEELMEELYELN